MKSILKNIQELKAKDVIIALIILALPFLYFLYRLAPDTAVWEIGWFTIDSGLWEDTQYYLWLVCKKLLLIISLIIWLFTCKHWWRYVILVPLIIELFKLDSIYNDKVIVVDEMEYLYSLPVIIPVMFFIIILTNKVGYFSKHQDLDNEVNSEIENLLAELELNNNKKSIIEDFEMLKLNKSILNEKEYKIKLMCLRQKLVKL